MNNNNWCLNYRDFLWLDKILFYFWVKIKTMRINKEIIVLLDKIHNSRIIRNRMKVKLKRIKEIK